MIGIPFRIRFSKSWGYPQIIPMSNNHCNIFQQLWWRKTLEISIDFSRSIHPSIHPSVHPSIHRSVKWGDFMGRQSLGYEDFMGTYPLANIQKAVENPPFEWVNQLFLWSFSIAMLNYGQDWGLSRNGRMNVSGKLISLRRRSVLRLWYICGLAWSKTTFWKNQSEK